LAMRGDGLHFARRNAGIKQQRVDRVGVDKRQFASNCGQLRERSRAGFANREYAGTKLVGIVAMEVSDQRRPHLQTTIENADEGHIHAIGAGAAHCTDHKSG